ncbi:MAG TPA: adventurous gliding motility lipoprotein CglC [Myxococcales bacterium]|nr:adventurous gliding motility lipoprotein CglC [Myxococcales bacterium]
MRSLSTCGFGALWLSLAAASCSLPSDLGTPCGLLAPVPDGGDGGGALLATDGGGDDDYLYLGSATCENLVCVRPAGSTLDGGYGICSNLCTPDSQGVACGPSQDCDTAHTGLVCRSLTIDPNFVKEIEAEDGGEALLDQYLGGPNATYCATPSPDGGC